MGTPSSLIVETASFQDVLDYIIPSTLILCDLDNTLIECSQYHGSIQWEEDYQKQQHELGETHEDSWIKAHNLWVETLPIVSMRLVDEQIPDIIQKILVEEIVLGLTARPPEVADITFTQLNQLGIHFDKRFISQSFILKDGTSFENGIIFCDRVNNKSEVLLKFLNHLDKLPNRIIFIDDKLGHVKDVESSLSSLCIDFVGIRYNKVDQRFKDQDEQFF